jgi:AcrR family transcriptional regulator
VSPQSITIVEVHVLLKGTSVAARKREISREERREHIVEKAREVFSRNRYNEVTVGAITAEAGIAKGTFYLYFDSKEELFVEVIRDAISRLRRAIADAVASVDDPMQKVQASVPVILDICGREAGLYMAIFQQAAFLESDRHEEYNALYEPLAKDFQATIEEGMKRGVFKPGNPAIISHGVFGFMASLIQQWLLLKASGGVPEGYLDQMSETIGNFFCYGLMGEKLAVLDEMRGSLQARYKRELEEVQERQRDLDSLAKIIESLS